jgi:gentisate 1,2-dioxygenase
MGKTIQDLFADENCQPLWDRYRNLVSREPISLNESLHWQWQRMQPLIESAIAATTPDEAERRVLLLTHPGFQGRAATTNSILGGLQVLQPGEVAHAHRHALGALRFVMQGSGAVTSVNGKLCPMEKGDFIVTPSWHWHEHVNGGPQRLVWFDCLDLPLVQHLSTVFFEPGTGSAPMPSQIDEDAGQHQYRFPWEQARLSLLNSPALEDGTKIYRYPQAWLPALDCQLRWLPKGGITNSIKRTSSEVMVVVEGEGETIVGGVSHKWKANDVVSLPHWQSTHHKATDNAIVFVVTDKPLLTMLGYYREE